MEVRLTRFKDMREVLRSMRPWLVTIAVLILLNLKGASLIEGRAEWIFRLAALNLGVVLVGLFVQYRFLAHPREFKLLVERDCIELQDASGAVLWSAPRRGLTVTREILVTRTRSGTYRNPVLGLRSSTDQPLGAAPKPLFLLNPHSTTSASSAASVTPHYVVATLDDFAKLSRELGQ